MELRKFRALSARRDLVAGVSALVVWSSVSACAVGGQRGKKAGSGSSIVKQCILPSEQGNSLQGKWGSTPIKVSVHAGDFDASEINAIQAGGATWNNFFSASKGLQIFDVGGSGGNQVATVQVAPACSSGTLSEGTVLYKRSSNWTKSSAAIAVTTTCFTPSTSGGIATLFNAIMEFNFVNFYTAASGLVPDTQSIAVHELGHLLGLDHSCGPLGRPNQTKSFLVCPDVSSDPNNSIIGTVMFPQVFFDQSGAGEVKRELTENDQGRANCLY